jgi:hypothetical protein
VLFVGFVAANYGSVPIFKGFPKKPYFFNIGDDQIVPVPRASGK